MESKNRIGIYPGTFDPITKGHIDIIKRATTLVDRLIIGVAQSSSKSPLFSCAERVALIKQDIAHCGTEIEVKPFNNLLVDFAKAENAQLIIRGLRAVSDFEFEFQLFGINNRLAPDIQTVFLMTADKYQFLSSSMIRETAEMGGDVTHFVTDQVSAALKTKLKAA